MINADQINEIITQYQKHGWRLRRVLLTPASKKLLGRNTNVFADAGILESEIDAAWFSRPSAGDREAWELRRLGEPPFALFEVFEPDDDEEVREEARKDMEARMNQ